MEKEEEQGAGPYLTDSLSLLPSHQGVQGFRHQVVQTGATVFLHILLVGPLEETQSSHAPLISHLPWPHPQHCPQHCLLYV